MRQDYFDDDNKDDHVSQRVFSTAPLTLVKRHYIAVLYLYGYGGLRHSGFLSGRSWVVAWLDCNLYQYFILLYY